MKVPDVLPADVGRRFQEFVDLLQKAAGQNLHALILYGGVARGRYRPESSDINLLILLNDASTASLQSIAAILGEGLRTLRVDPFIITVAELPGAAESFPTKFLEIRKHHLVLIGENPFPSLQIARGRALIRIEQELLNMQMRLRRRYLAVHASPDLMYQTLRGMIVPLAVTLGAMLELNGHADPSLNTRGAVLEKAADVFNLDRATMQSLAVLRAGEPGEIEAQTLYSNVLDSIARAARCCVSTIQEAT